MNKLFSMLAVVAAAACGSEPGTGGDDDAPATDGGAGAIDGGGNQPDAFNPPQGSHTVTWGPLTVPPGSEDTRCVTVRLGNASMLRAHQIHNELGDASHHFIVYRVSDTMERPEPYACDPFAGTLNPDGSGDGPLMITQKFDETLTLPDGVAFTLQPDQMIRLEMHYINAGETEQELVATSTFIPIAEAEFQHEADFLFMGDINISIPPMSAHTLGPTYMALPGELADANFFAITGHEHQWGTDVFIETATSQGGAGTAVYDIVDFNWDEPDTVYFDPTFQVPTGGGFRWTCEWFNGSNETVTFGEGANEEMCFFWAYYYPSIGPRVCFAHSGFGVSACCPGGPSFICDML